MSNCPVCGTPGASSQAPVAGFADTDAVECPRCGRFLLSGTARVVLEGLLQRRTINNSRLSHVLRVRYDAQPRKPPFLQRETDLEPYQNDLSHVPPQQQLDNFILWVGNNQGAPQEWAKSNIHALAARVGSGIGSDTSELGLAWLINEFHNLGLYSFQRGGGSEESYRFKPAGWTRFDELNRRVVHSRNAFMAMKFGDARLDEVLRECFQPATARAGFTLKPLNEQPAAGLIDNQIRAAIRTARFVVADLSHDNDGAYFEAGFAEGLGLPVIYTCEAGKFAKEKTHFDTNHMVTVLWDADKLNEAGRTLTATIRNTLPLESKLDD
jgi:hypothetical protein